MANPVRWFELMGKDGNSLRQFCRELFHWKITSGAAQPGFDYELVAPGHGGIAGGVGSGSDGSSSHATFLVEVDSPAAFLDRATHLGGRVVMPEVAVESTNLKFAYFADPEGNVIGLSNGIGQSADQDPDASPVLAFEVMAENPMTLREFYAKLFKWTLKQAAAFDYWTIDTGDAAGITGGIGPVQAAGRPNGKGFATFKVEVDDPNSVLRQAGRLGGTTVMPVVEVPGTKVKVAYIGDPEGHVIGLTTGLV